MPASESSSESQDRDKRGEASMPILTEEQRKKMNEELQEKLEAAKKELRSEKDPEDKPKASGEPEPEQQKEKDRDGRRRHRRSEERGRREGSGRRRRDTDGSGRRRDTDGSGRRRDTDRRRDTGRAEANEPDPGIVVEQEASTAGLYCRWYGVDGCRKYLSSSWAYKQHLACKHGFSKSFAETFVSKQWKELEDHLGPVPPPEQEEQRPKASLRPAAERDMRRPAEPARPPKAPRSSSEAPSVPSAPSQSSDANAAGIELLRAMWQDVATRVFKE